MLQISHLKREENIYLLDESALKGEVASHLWDAVSFPVKFTVIGQFRGDTVRWLGDILY